MTPNRQLLLAFGLCLVALVGLVATACDSANPVAPSGTFLSVSAAPSSIGLNETSTITVIGRRPDGSALFEGTEILLSTNLGTLDRTVVEVDSTGSARALLRGDGRQGTATVTATTGTGSGGEGGATMATVDVQVGVASEAKPVVTLTVNPSIIDIQESATVTVIGRNSDGSPVGAGQSVVLTTSLGRLAQSRLTTDADGIATTTLTAGDQSGSAEVTAFLGASDAVSTTLTIRDTATTVLISTDKAQVNSAGDTVMLTATVFNAQSEPLSGVLVSFQSDAGSLNPATRTTDPQGQALSTLTLTQTDLNGRQTVTVSARIAGPNGQVVINSETLVVN